MICDEPFLLGIDGGGTSCRARVCSRDGAVLGEGRAGSANVRLGLDQAFGAVFDATRNALSAAGLGESTMAGLYAGLGLAGLNIAAILEEAKGFPLPFAKTTFVTDTEIARLGAHEGGDGGIVIVGTGSCAEARIDGQTLRIGGWGFELSDQGSGAAIGQAALRQSLLAHDGLAPRSTLDRAILDEFDHDPEAMVIWADRATPKDYARFSETVLAHAADGDVGAIAIIQDAAKAIGRLILALNAAGAEPIATLGGMAKELRPWLGDEARSHLIEPKGTALDGAILLAHRLLLEDEPDAA